MWGGSAALMWWRRAQGPEQSVVQVARTSAGAAFRYAGLKDAFVTILRDEGFAAFFRGSAFSYLKIPISIGAMYALYEVASNVMAWDGLRSCAPRRILCRVAVPLTRPVSTAGPVPLPGWARGHECYTNTRCMAAVHRQSGLCSLGPLLAVTQRRRCHVWRDSGAGG